MAETEVRDVLAERVERVERIDEKVDALRGDVHALGERQARIEGLSEQMDRRLSNVEQNQRQQAASQEQGFRWVIGIMLGTWVTLGLLILGLYLKG